MGLHNLIIKSGQGDYSVDFHPTLADLIVGLVGVPNAVVIVDSNVARLYAAALAPLLAARPTLQVEATEDEKTPSGVTRVWEFFQRSDAKKQTHVIVIGGGITQDIGQFAAHNYYRGLSWHYVPTTLLGMADSCIGAKCGINLGAFKNQLGVFHSPAKVRICSEFLSSLSDEDIRSGYGEILKLLLTGSNSQYAMLKETVNGRGLRNDRLDEFILESLMVKKRVIEQDEYERNLRRILNYGHTFGHSLEAVTHHAVSHGVAVAWGIDLVNYVSLKRGLLSEENFKNIHGFIESHFQFRLPNAVTAEQIAQGIKRDKKILDGKVSLILLASPGDLRIVPTVLDESLTLEVAEYLKCHNVFHWD